jgi:hypothetical protein
LYVEDGLEKDPCIGARPNLTEVSTLSTPWIARSMESNLAKLRGVLSSISLGMDIPGFGMAKFAVAARFNS